ncbi:MAG: type II toxin-antitoxin system RelE/ParE family toxin [Spirochaetes bacterium]|nr:type II toxin-antitoxin system RelE/ParE family toxin [Spirochaetota bacterium]
MACEVRYKASVEKDLRKIPRADAKRIMGRIDTDLTSAPGKDKQLSGNFKGLYSYRVGDYRVVYSLHGEVILVLRIAHRKDVYKE